MGSIRFIYTYNISLSYSLVYIQVCVWLYDDSHMQSLLYAFVGPLVICPANIDFYQWLYCALVPSCLHLTGFCQHSRRLNIAVEKDIPTGQDARVCARNGYDVMKNMARTYVLASTTIRTYVCTAIIEIFYLNCFTWCGHYTKCDVMQVCFTV